MRTSSDVQTSSGNDYVPEHEWFSAQTGAVKEAAKRGKRDNLYEVGTGVRDGFYAYVWPNVSLNLFVPIDTHRTLAVYEYCFADAVPDEQVEDFTRFIDQVQNEDVAQRSSLATTPC
jgi:hypothetical protein